MEKLLRKSSHSLKARRNLAHFPCDPNRMRAALWPRLESLVTCSYQYLPVMVAGWVTMCETVSFLPKVYPTPRLLRFSLSPVSFPRNTRWH